MRAALPNHRFSDSTSSLVTMEAWSSFSSFVKAWILNFPCGWRACRRAPTTELCRALSNVVALNRGMGGVLLRSRRTIFYRRDDEAVVSGELVLQEKEHAQEKKEHAQENKKEQD
ncbi:uncharacterized protein [Aegilops tauschii subsp. strangulata]|uniref:uncharacterized protein n=1 Tax=Aegilops tauschii subsp. strangulata TaxID=200361 RepID=UPI001E1CAC3B|nr:uncharacterized protein LOC109737546 [Aegilops tauschii subsp. strangulata]